MSAITSGCKGISGSDPKSSRVCRGRQKEAPGAPLEEKNHRGRARMLSDNTTLVFAQDATKKMSSAQLESLKSQVSIPSCCMSENFFLVTFLIQLDNLL
jgi:hypothetical protein